MIELNALKSFVLAAETLNFTSVAEQRHTVQSAISSHIAKLETDLGRTLFQRGRGKSMRLTKEGEAFLVYAHRILTLSDEAVEAIRSAPSQRDLRLGTTVTLALSIVSEALKGFASNKPEVQIHIDCDRSDALLGRLDAGEIDVAFMLDQGKRPGRAFVHSQPLAWVCGSEAALPANDDIPLAFLTNGRDLRHYALEALDTAGKRGYIAHLSPHPIGVRAFVQSGLALTVMPSAAVVPPLQIVPEAAKLPKLAPIAIACYHSAGNTNNDITLLQKLLERSLS